MPLFVTIFIALSAIGVGHGIYQQHSTTRRIERLTPPEAPPGASVSQPELSAPIITKPHPLKPTDPNKLNEWACNKVYELIDKPGGCYDICYQQKTFPGLSRDQLITITNACAVVLHGAEW